MRLLTDELTKQQKTDFDLHKERLGRKTTNLFIPNTSQTVAQQQGYCITHMNY